VFILWLAACGLPFLGPCLRPDPGMVRLGACSFWPLIRIRGPCLAHPLLMILSSRPMVCSCGPDAWLTSIVNFFIFPFIVSAGPELPPRTCVCFDKFNHRKSIKRGKTSSYHIWDRLSSLELEACGLFLLEISGSWPHKREINPAHRE